MERNEPPFPLVECVARVRSLIDSGTYDVLGQELAKLHGADLASLIGQLSINERAVLYEKESAFFTAEVISSLDEAVREEVVDVFSIRHLSRLVGQMESDDAVEMIESLSAEKTQKLLSCLSAEARALCEEGLSYPEKSAGRTMRREIAVVPLFWTVGQVIDSLRGTSSSPEAFYNLIVVNTAHQPVGFVRLSQLLRSQRSARMSDVMDRDLHTVPVLMEQEDIGFLFQHYALVEAPVVDEGGRLLGSITIDDVLNVLEEEHADDILRLGGVGDDDFYAAAFTTARSRSWWLLINLGTAVLASSVIALFQTSLQQIVSLAVLMPIIASMGGNAGTQTLTVAVRALAANELTAANATRIIMKEFFVGSINGLLFAVVMALITWIWFLKPGLGLVAALAMLINLLAAALAGIVVPLTLERMGRDPAIASPAFVTTVTDVVGFFSFLGLATLFLT